MHVARTRQFKQNIEKQMTDSEYNRIACGVFLMDGVKFQAWNNKAL